MSVSNGSVSKEETASKLIVVVSITRGYVTKGYVARQKSLWGQEIESVLYPTPSFYLVRKTVFSSVLPARLQDVVIGSDKDMIPTEIGVSSRPGKKTEVPVKTGVTGFPFFALWDETQDFCCRKSLSGKSVGR